MATQGNSTFILLDRKLLNHQHWKQGKFDYGKAWVDLLLRASYTDHKVRVEGDYNRFVEIKRGQILCSQIGLAKRWGWSRGKVRRFISVLKTDHQIEQQTTPYYTLITILNYDSYQDISSYLSDTANDTTKSQQTDTIKEGTKKGQGINTIGEVSNDRIKYGWQEEALRTAKKLGIKFPNDKTRTRWFGVFKECYQRKKQGALSTAYSYTIDHPKLKTSEDKMKAYLWKVFEILK